MILYRYIARRFAFAFFATMGIFAVILGLIDLVEQLRRHAGDGIAFGRIAGLAALNMPGTLYALLPLITILATLSLFLSLSRSSEMVVTRAAGRSALASLRAPVLVSLVLGALAVAALNPIVAATSERYRILSDRLTGDGSTLSVAEDGLWLRQGGEGRQTVIRARRASPDGTELDGATFLTFDDTGTPLLRIEARGARLEDGAWVIDGAKLWSLETPNPEVVAETREVMRLPTDMTAARIRETFAAPQFVPIWELPAFIARLETAGLSSQAHRMFLWGEIALPAFMAAMTMIAAAFTMRHTRVSRTGLMVLMAVLTGFGLYFVRNFSQVLGETGQLPVLLAAWAPPLAGIFLAAGLVLHLEDG